MWLIGAQGEGRAHALAIGVISLACCGSALLITPTLDLQSLLPVGIAVLLALLSALSGALSYLLLVPLRITRLSVSGFSIVAGDRRLSAPALRRAYVEDEHLVLETPSGQIRIPASKIDEAQLQWICHQLRALRERWEARGGSVPSEVARLVEQIDAR